jgi:hypothetical protein
MGRGRDMAGLYVLSKQGQDRHLIDSILSQIQEILHVGFVPDLGSGNSNHVQGNVE